MPATKQFLISGTSDDPTIASTQYSILLGDGGTIWHATEEARTSIISTPGKLSNFEVQVAVPPGNGKSWVFTVRKGASGQAMADTLLSVTISGTDVISALDTDEVVVSDGERVSISATPSSPAPAACVAVYWTCQFTPDIDGETILLSNNVGSAFTASRYHPLVGGKFNDTAEFDAQTLFSTVGTLKKFFVELDTPPGNGNSRIFTIRKNGVATGLVVTISGSNIAGSDTDPEHNVTIAAGDKVTIINTVTGSPASSSGKFGIVFLPNIQGEYIASATTDDPTDTTAVEYQHLNCGVTALTSTEIEQHNLAQATLAKAIYVNLATAPNNGNTWIFTLRRNASVTTALTVSISNNNTSGNAAVDVTISADDLLDTEIDATPGTKTSKSQIAYLLYNAPILVRVPRGVTIFQDPAIV